MVVNWSYKFHAFTGIIQFPLWENKLVHSPKLWSSNTTACMGWVPKTDNLKLKLNTKIQCPWFLVFFVFVSRMRHKCENEEHTLEMHKKCSLSSFKSFCTSHHWNQFMSHSTPPTHYICHNNLLVDLKTYLNKYNCGRFSNVFNRLNVACFWIR